MKAKFHFVLALLAPLALFVRVQSFFHDHRTTPEFYSLIKIIDLNPEGQGFRSPVSPGWMAYDHRTETFWVGNPGDQDVVVLDAIEYNIRVILPNLLETKHIAFSERFALVADSAAQQIKVFDKVDYALLQTLEITGNPQAVYIDPVSGALWALVSDSIEGMQYQVFSANPLWNPERYDPVPLTKLTLPVWGTPPAKAGFGGIFSGNLYQPINGVIYVINLHYRVIVYSIPLPIAGTTSITSICYDLKAGNLVVATDTPQVLFVSIYDQSIQAIIDTLGPTDQCSIAEIVNRGYLANTDSENENTGLVTVLDLSEKFLLQNFTQAAPATESPAQRLATVSYPGSTEVWTFSIPENAVLVYEWIRHVSDS
jgi:hypothetical protein